MKPILLDTHFHIWDTSRISYPWVEAAQATPQWFLGPNRLPLTYSLADYTREWGPFGVRPFVHVEAGAAPESATAETDAVLLAADVGGALRLVVGVDLERPNLVGELERQCEHAEVVGVRQIVTWDRDQSRSFISEDVLSRPQWRDGFRLLESLGLGFDLQIHPSQAHAAAYLAGSFPAVRFVLNHAGMPILDSAPELKLWKSSLSTLAAHENVAIKIGGFSMTNVNLSTAQIENAVLDTLDAFGSRRVVIGTNAPVESTRKSPKLSMDGLWAALGALSQAEVNAIAQENAHNWYPVRT